MVILTRKDLTEEEIDELKEFSVFDSKEIENLYYRFQYLDRSNTGFLTFAEFQMIPEFHGNPFCSLIISYIEELNQYEKINFACFLQFMSIFSPKSDKSTRINYLFAIFDLDKTGKLTKDVLMRISAIINSEPIESEVVAVLNHYDSEKKGFLNKEDFSVLYNNDESLEKNMLIDFTKSIDCDNQSNVWDIIWPSNKND